MLRLFKKKLYFIVAWYFRFFAQIQLASWKPRVIVVTGSSGKTTLLHLIESQLKDKARYSHHANSTFGIPFDILGLKRTNLVASEWVYLFLAAPIRAFKKPFAEKIYIVEVDCERPDEGQFLASLLKPEVTLWINTGTTHSINFDYLVSTKKYATVEEAIAYEFGFLLQYTTRLAIVNGDQKLIMDQINRTKAQTKVITKNQVQIKHQISFLLPEESSYSIAMTQELVSYLHFDFDPTFANFTLPPGRSSVFKGIKNITIIDSSYNATPDGMAAILEMFDQYSAKVKWLVLGDMIELGEEEQVEHEKLAELINTIKCEKIILIGPRVLKYIYPKLNQDKTIKFEQPKEGLDYLTANIQGNETILFKGARFLEGIIEHLLLNKTDISKLCRREKIWQIRRKQWGL